MPNNDDHYVDPYEQGPSLFDWNSIGQFIISAFKGFGNFLDYLMLPAEDKQMRARVNGWISNKVERPPEELYSWEREGEVAQAEKDKAMAQGVVDDFDKLLDRYADAHPEFVRPEKYSDDWFTALEEANTHFTSENQKINTEYQQTLAVHKQHKAEEAARLAAIERKQTVRAKTVYKELSKNGNTYTPKGYYSAADTKNTSTIALHDHPLLVMLRGLESGDNYNITLGRADLNLAEMSINEVIAWQEANPYTASNGDTMDHVVGAYQFKPGTLRLAMKEVGISGTEKMSADTQDRLAWALAERRGYSDFINGTISKERFIGGTASGKHRQGLAGEWAVLPYSAKGVSAYNNDHDKAGIKWDALVGVLEDCKKFDIADNATVGYPVFVKNTNSPLGARDISRNKKYDPKPHRGEDFAIVEDTNVMAIAGGVVTDISTQINSDTGRGYGKRIALSHRGADGQFNAVSMAAHLNGYPTGIKVGDEIKRGQTIGFSGDSGSDGSHHLHFETGFYVQDEKGKLALCMVSFSDIMDFHDQLHKPEVIAHLIDRAYVRHRGNADYKDGVDGLRCTWLSKIPADMRPTDLSALPSYNFTEAKTRLAPYATKSTGYKTAHTAFPAFTPPADKVSVSQKMNEFNDNKKSYSPSTGNGILFGVPLNLGSSYTVNLES